MSNRIANYLAPALLFFLLLSCSRTSPPADNDHIEQLHLTSMPPTPSLALDAEPAIVAATVPARMEGYLSLPDGATLYLPEGSLQPGSLVAIEKLGIENFPPVDDSVDVSVGAIYKFDVGVETLSKPVIIEIPFDPGLIPEDSLPDQLFLAHYKEESRQWVYAGGQVDQERNVVALPITQTSLWSPRVWDWPAWIVFVNDVLQERIKDTISSARLFDCLQVTNNISVASDAANQLLQGCIVVDDPDLPEIKVANPRSFFVELDANPMVTSLSSSLLLEPGDTYNVKVHTLALDPPLIISADVTQKTLRYFFLDLLLTILPGDNQPGQRPELVACLAATMPDSSDLYSAIEALADHDGLAVAEELARMLRDEDVMRHFIAAAGECSYRPATTWSLSGLNTMGNSASIVASVADIFDVFMANQVYSEVRFLWMPRRAEIRNQTQVYLQDTMLLDSDQDTHGCFGIDQISYSPTLDHFLVIVGCFEGDNEAFLFRADGSGKQHITGEWDYLNYDFFDWSPDGQYFVYQRINSCCADVPVDAPPSGLVRYDVASGEKKLLLTGAGKPKWSPDGNWLAFLRIAYPTIHVDVLTTDGLNSWRLDTLNYSDPWLISLTWEQTEIAEVLNLNVTQSGQQMVYTVSMRPGDPAPGTPMPFPTFLAYRVINVRPDDVLNVRSGPGVDNPIVGVIPPDGTGIQVIGDEVGAGNSLWVPISYQDITGWINKSFLIEQSSDGADESP